MLTDAVAALPGAVAAGGAAVAGWALLKVHAIAVRVAVLENERGHGERTDDSLRAAIDASEGRLSERIAQSEQATSNRIEALAAKVLDLARAVNGGPSDSQDG